MSDTADKRMKINRTRGEVAFDTVNVLFMILFCLLTIYPFWYVLILSLNDGQDAARGVIYLWPRVFTLDNYQFVVKIPDIQQAFLVTSVRSLVGPLFSLILHMIAGYALSKRNLPGRKGILLFYLIPSFIGGSVVSTFVVIAKLGLINNFLVYILPPAFNFFTLVICRTFIEQLPPDIEESAKMDGAGYFITFITIIAPLCKPIMATVAFFGVVFHWLDFGSNLLYVNDKNLFTLQYVLYRIVRSNDTGSIMEEMMKRGAMPRGSASQRMNPESIKNATLVYITFPILFVYPFFQKYFVKGILVGAVKA